MLDLAGIVILALAISGGAVTVIYGTLEMWKRILDSLIGDNDEDDNICKAVKK